VKILWFTNNTVNLDKGLTRGGWMQRLEQQLGLDESIQLTIVSRYNGDTIRTVAAEHSTYYLVPDRRSRWRKRLDNLLNREPLAEWQQQYATVIAAVQPDIIQVFGTEMDYGLVAGLTDIPVVIHIQGILQPIQYHLNRIPIPWRTALFAQRPLDYVKGATLGNSKKVWQRRVATEQCIYKMARYFMGRTEWDRSLTRLLAPQAQYFHCDEMLRQEFLESEWLNQNNDRLHLVSTLSNPIYKGHDTLIATCRVLKKYSSTEFIWHVIGLDKTGQSYRVFYKPYMDYLGEVIRFHGELGPAALIEVLQQADIYIHPSHIENSCNSLCEAMALGMPVIALHTGGNSSVINQGVDGLLVADNDPYVLAEAILNMAADSHQARIMAANARRKAIERHNPVTLADQLKAIYRAIIHHHQVDLKKHHEHTRNQ